MKLITNIQSSTHLVKVIWSEEYEEYVCELYKVDGFSFTHIKHADYFTDDKQDAIGTAQAMINKV